MSRYPGDVIGADADRRPSWVSRRREARSSLDRVVPTDGAVRQSTWSPPAETERFISAPRAEAALRSWYRGSSLLLVRAPSGYGKTTVVSHWARSLDGAVVVWISCGGWIADWATALGAVEQALVEVGVLSRSFGSRGIGDPQAFAELRNAQADLVIVYDDFDKLEDAPPLETVIRANRQVPRLRTIVIRSGRERRVSSIEPAGSVLIDEQDLRWSAEMVGEAAVKIGLPVQRSSVAPALVDAAAGRASAIVRYLETRLDRPDSSGRGRQLLPADVIVGWSLDGIAAAVGSDDAVDVFLTVAVSLRMPSGLLLSLAPAAGQDFLIDRLVDEGLVTELPADASVVTEYEVPLRYRDVAERLAASRFGRERLAAIHRTAANYHREHGSVENEIFHRARGGDGPIAIELLTDLWRNRRAGMSMVDLCRAMAAIPDDLYRENPHALAMRAVFSRCTPVPGTERPDLETYLLSLSMSRVREIALQDRMIVVAAKVAILVSRGQIPEAVVLGNQFVSPTVTAGWDAVPALLDDLAAVLAFTGEAVVASGSPRRGLALIQRARGLDSQEMVPFRRFRYSSLTAFGLALSGDAAMAEAALDEAIACLPLLDPLTFDAEYPMVLTRALLATRTLDSATLLEAAERFALFAHQGGPWSPTARICEAFGLFYAGRPERALAVVRELLHGATSVSASAAIGTLAVTLDADLKIALDRPAVAAKGLLSRESPEGHTFCVAVQRASAHLAMGEPRLALADTEACLELGAAHSLRSLPSVLLRRAVAHELLGREASADEAFVEAFELIRVAPTLTPFVNVSRTPIDTLIARLSARRPEYAGELLALTDELNTIEGVFLKSPPPVTLTEKERLVLQLLAERKTIAQIGEVLFVSPNTVKSQVSSIYRKLGIQKRREAITMAVSMGLSPSEQ